MPEPGARITEHVRLIDRIGHGAMGEVWLAEHSVLRSRVAVKLVAPDADDIYAADRLRREAAATACLQSPHAVSVFDCGDMADGHVYMVMELLEGRTLQDVIDARGPLDLELVAAILEQIADVLDEAHGLGIVHRDVKPHNIFVTKRGGEVHAKLVDFGSATVDDSLPRMTLPGHVVGSPAYLSRDVLLDLDEPDGRADLWALGVTVFKALTGELPFRGAGIVATCAHIIDGKLPRASKLRRGLPVALDLWFARVFSHEPRLRPASARDMARGLKTIARRRFPRVLLLTPLALAVVVALVLSPDTLATRAVDTSLAAVFAPGLEMAAAEQAASGPIAPVAEDPASRLAPPELREAARRTRVAIASGWAWMGCAPSEQDCDDPVPPSRVHVRAFAMDQTEVPAVDYARCVRGGVCSAEGLHGHALDGAKVTPSSLCNFGRAERQLHPINCVTHQQAEAYCGWLGARLPSEAEWVRAARGEGRAVYPWGDAEASCSLAVMREGPPGCSAAGTWPVASKPRGASPLGVLGLAGNVREWVSGWYLDAPDGRRVGRGGSWDNSVGRFLRISARTPLKATMRSVHLGFRCASDRSH